MQTERDRNLMLLLQIEEQRTAVALSPCSHTRTTAMTQITKEGADDIAVMHTHTSWRAIK